MFKESVKCVFKKISRVCQECFKEVLFCNFVVAWISSQLPEQKEGLFIFHPNQLGDEEQKQTKQSNFIKVAAF